MNHNIALHQWIDYLDQSLEENKRRQIDAHLLVCSACRETYATMRETEAVLRSGSAQLKAISVPFPVADRLPRAAEPHNSPEHLFTTLTSVLAPICGTETSERIWRAAGRRASLDPVTEPVAARSTLLRHLRSITGSLCGEDAARLIWEFGMELERSQV